MINISVKDKTKRTAKAYAFVRLSKNILKKIKENNIPKGDVLETSRIAAIMAVKNTPQLIPMCHTIEIEHADINFIFKINGISVESSVSATSKTGVEMEAITAVTIAAVNIYDMCKMFDKSIEITNIYLLEKTGGKSGIYKRTR